MRDQGWGARGEITNKLAAPLAFHAKAAEAEWRCASGGRRTALCFGALEGSQMRPLYRLSMNIFGVIRRLNKITLFLHIAARYPVARKDLTAIQSVAAQSRPVFLSSSSVRRYAACGALKA